MKIAKEGLLFILPFLALALTSLVFYWWIAFILFALITLAFCFFFRDPSRRIPPDENHMVSPADGRIVKIETLDSHPSFPSSATVTTLSIFLSLFDVHLTRAPLTGTIQRIEYRPGRFFPAYKDEASLKNESNSLFIKGERVDVILRQVVGIAARRIKCFVREKERIEKGQKIGLMYFGSRVEVTLPADVLIKAYLNQKVKAGETIIAEVKK